MSGYRNARKSSRRRSSVTSASVNDPIDIARSFARDVVAPNAARWELERALPRQAVTEAARAGLGGRLAPPSLGRSVT